MGEVCALAWEWRLASRAERNLGTEESGMAQPSHVERRKDFAVFFLILCSALLIRLPFFFPAVIDWDESTYIIMGQSILDGNLPYIEQWEDKPPLAYLFYA